MSSKISFTRNFCDAVIPKVLAVIFVVAGIIFLAFTAQALRQAWRWNTALNIAGYSAIALACTILASAFCLPTGADIKFWQALQEPATWRTMGCILGAEVVNAMILAAFLFPAN